MRDRIIAILEAHLSATDEWDGAKLASWRYGDNVVVDGIEDAADEIMKLLPDIAPNDPIALQGYSYPSTPLTVVIAAEAQQGRTVRVAIQHAGGWAVTEGWGCTCLEYQGDDENCPAHRRKGQTT